MSFLILLLLALIATVSAFVQGLSGFGFPLLAVPLFSMYLPVRVAVPITTALSAAVNLTMIREVRHIRPHLKTALLLIAGCALTSPLGVLCLKYVDADLIKILLGVLSLVCAFLLFKGLRLPIRRVAVWAAVVGLLCGFLSGLANLAGPLLIVFLNNLNLEKRVFRAFTILLFTAMGGFSLTNIVVGGLFTREALLATVIMMPLVLLGTWVGARHSHKIKEASFRKLTLLILVATSVSILVAGAMAFVRG